MKYPMTTVFAFLLIIACSKKNSDPIAGENSSSGDIVEKPFILDEGSPSTIPTESISTEVKEQPADPQLGDPEEEHCHGNDNIKKDNMKQNKCDDNY